MKLTIQKLVLKMDCAKYVNVFYGSEETTKKVTDTLADKWVYLKGMCGNTHPGATEPFGKMSVCAYSGGYPTGYGTNCPNSCGKIKHFTQKKMMKGFSHCHQYGVGAIGIYYNYCVITPLYSDNQYELTEIINEKAYPSYYSGTFKNSGIKGEVTVYNSVAHHRYYINKNTKIKIDTCNDGLDKSFGKNFYSIPELISFNKINGNIVAFTIKSFEIEKHFAVWVSNAESLEFDEESKVCTFFVNSNCEIKVAMSLKSLNNAVEDIINDKNDFETAQSNAYAQWNEYLSKIDAQFENENDKKLFYTLFYQSLIKPCNFSGESFLYKEKDFFADIATMWDIYKTQLPLIFSLYKNESEQLVSTFINCYKSFNSFPNSITLNNNLNVEDKQAVYLMAHSIADAYFRGIKADYKSLENLEFPRLSNNAYPPHILDVVGGYSALSNFVNIKNPNVELNDAFDSNTGLLRNAQYYEGDIFNYSFRLLNDMKMRFQICPEDKYENYLDEFFGFTQNKHTYLDDKSIIDDKPAVKNMFEGFNNEPDMETPYNYVYLNKRDKLKNILDSSYKLLDVNDNSAFPGNCDSGGLSACFLWNMLGIFPLTGQNKMIVGFPKCKSAVLHLYNGKTLTIKADEDTILINGKTVNENFISLNSIF